MNKEEMIELIEGLIRKYGDDIAVGIARSFERLEERMDAIERRNASRLSDLEDKIEASKK